MTQVQPRPGANGVGTRFLVGLIGRGIGPSLSPALHTQEAEALGLDYDYRLHDLDELCLPDTAAGEVLDQLRASGYCAANITYPCKQQILPHLDEIDPDAARLGAVNLVIIRDGRYIGYNTDWMGFRNGIVDGLSGRPIDEVVQFGGGGAGSASAYAMLALGTRHLILADLDRARAEELAQRLRTVFGEAYIDTAEVADAPDILAPADGAINATPLGMASHPGVPFDVAHLRDAAWVADVVYFPIETALLRAAAARGLTTLDGGRMNVGQAVEGIRLITGVRPDAARMRAHFLELVASHALAGTLTHRRMRHPLENGR